MTDTWKGIVALHYEVIWSYWNNGTLTVAHVGKKPIKAIKVATEFLK